MGVGPRVNFCLEAHANFGSPGIVMNTESALICGGYVQVIVCGQRR